MTSLRVATSPRPPLLSEDSGPGLRWVLFLQGCARPCTRVCLNPHYLDPAGGVAVSISALRLLVAQIGAGTWGPVEGVTVLGGEPTDQAAGLLPLLGHARAAGLSVMLYSGHTREWFDGVPEAAALLPLVDLLVDGPFVERLADATLRWRGSTNQRILRLTDRYTAEDIALGMERRGITLTRPSAGAGILSGMQDREAVVGLLSEGKLRVNPS